MENNKAKNVIIVILIILLMLCLGVVTWQYIKINNDSNNTENSHQPITNNNQSENQNTNNSDRDAASEKEDENSTKLGAAYVKYSDIKWQRDKKVDARTWGVEIYIDAETNKVSIIYEDLITQEVNNEIVKNIEGTPKYVVGSYDCGGFQQSVILTEQGTVYISGKRLSGDVPINEYKKINLDEKIVDVATLKDKRPMTCSSQTFYFLTETGKLINSNNETYEEVNGDIKDYIGGMVNTIYIYNDNTIGFIEYEKCDDNNFKEKKSKFYYNSKEVIAKNIFAVEENLKEKIYIYTDKGELLLRSDEGYELTLYSSGVKDLEGISEKEVKIYYMDGTSKIFDNAEIWL